MTLEPAAAPEATSAACEASALEFLRSGVGATLSVAAGVVQPLYVSRSNDDREALWICDCRSGRRSKACDHIEALGRQVDACHAAWGGRSWQPALEASVWFALAQACFVADACDSAGVRAVPVTIEGRSGHRLETAASGTLLGFVPRSDANARLLDRLGVGPLGRGEGSRARLLDRLQRFQATDTERAMNDRDIFTQRQAFERSVYGRVAYHSVREPATGGTFHPRVDRASADFLLSYRAEGAELLRLVVPRSSVAAVLALLHAAYPEQQDLALRPVPLKSLFMITRATELDVEVRPMIEALQATGEARFFDRADVERFRYGRLVYLPEMEVLAELESPGSSRKFAAPTRMTLARSQVPALIERVQAEAEVVVDGALHPLAVLKEPSEVEVADVRTETDDYWAALRYRFGAAAVGVVDVLRARERGLPYLEVEGGWVDLASPCFDPLWSLRGATDPGLRKDDAVRLTPREVLRLATTLPLSLRGAGEGPEWEAWGRLLSYRAARRLPPATGLRSRLRFYQETGVDWLLFLWENRLAGLLCDDMGLGKTHQVMAFLLALVEHKNVAGPFLVVCPTSVLSHWRDKLRAFAPGLCDTVYHGSERRLPSSFAAGHVIVTSYGVLRNDGPQLARLGCAVAIFDEVQHIKNSDTVAYRAACDLPAPLKIGLTGTPIENHVGELKALLDLVLPGHLGSDQDFAARHGPGAGQAGRAHLTRRIAPFLLRRLKAEVLDELPAKIEDTRRCGLSPEQRALYREVVAGRGAALLETLKRGQEPIPYLHVFAVLNLLKRICDHPALALKRPDLHAEKASGKWDLFLEILNEALESGQKVVVFSQYLGMLDIMGRHLQSLGLGHVVLTGATLARGAVIDRFNTDPACRVFLGSLKAGGVGIDLVAGSVVIHYDRWWNAAREDQATDRVHRLGQQRAVQVFRLVTEGTLEERIARIIDAKRQLLGDVVAVDDPHLPKVFSREELITLLGPDQGA
jgi:superfamily II DNA or RNA helicase